MSPDPGDEGFSAFFASAEAPCLRAVVVTVRDPMLAEDLVGEAFVRALERWDRLHTHPNPAAWVVTTAVNLSRRRWWQRQREGDVPPGPVAVPAPDEPVDSVLLDAILRLPDRQREVVAYRIVLQASTDETADALGIAPKTVTVHLHRALSALRDDPRLVALWAGPGEVDGQDG